MMTTEPCGTSNALWLLEISHDVNAGMTWCFKFRFDHKPDANEVYQCWGELSRYTGYEIVIGDGNEYEVKLYREDESQEASDGQGMEG